MNAPISVSLSAGDPTLLDLAWTLAPVGAFVEALVVLAVIVLVRVGRHRTDRLRTVAYGALLGFALLGSPVGAQPVPDDMQCFKVTDATLRHLRGTVDLDAPSVGVAAGCRLSKPKLYCVPAYQHVQPATLFDGGRPLTELPYHGPHAATDRICYEVKCPSGTGTAPNRTATDRFGTHALTRMQTEMVCTPAVGGTMPPPAQGFQVTSPDIEISPGQDITWCYFFRTPNTAKLAVNRFQSELGPGGKGVVSFATTENGVSAERRPAGEVTTVGCDFYSGTTYPYWRYGGYGTSDALDFPTDDGNGHPLAMELPPNSAGVLMMHFKNETTAPVVTRGSLNVEALDDPVYTPTATLLSNDASIAIPPYSPGSAGRSCAVHDGARFWNLTTFTHKLATHTQVRDGLNVAVDNLDFADPATETLSVPPYRTFASGKLSHSCDYVNPNPYTVRTGQYQQSDEQCLGIGYFFPATTARLCVNGFVLQ